MKKPYCQFPGDFLWGAATAAYQVEGAASADGRGASVWDTFCRRPGATALNHNGDNACDHYHRYKEDVQLMKELGLRAYRFSISWSRVFPTNRRYVNRAGLDFYSRLVDELLAVGIKPCATLFHWDLPQWCEDSYGGWEARECSDDFADYASIVARTLGDRVEMFFTINEFMCFLDKAYTANAEVFAPGKVVSRRALNQARHHALLGHGKAVQSLRAASARPVKVGLAENIPNIVPLTESAEDIAAAGQALRELSGMYLTPIMEGKYHPAYLSQCGSDAPSFTDEDLQTISTRLDFVGLNLYAPTYIGADVSKPSGWRMIHCDSNYPRMHMPWLTIGPAIMYWCPRIVSDLWHPNAVYVTENGCAYPDEVDANGEVLDTARVMYLQQHLIHAHRAIAEGYPLKGYFLWSLMDNFEWAFGYTKRFGITHVNYDTMKRTKKLSFHFYADVIRRNAIGGSIA